MNLRSEPQRRRAAIPVLRRSLPALLGVLAVALLGVAALRIGQSHLAAAEQDRMTSRKGLITGWRTSTANGMDPAQRMQVTSLPRFTAAAGPVNTALLNQVRADRAQDVVFAAVVDAEGHVVQSSPEGLALDVGLLGRTWDGAMAGQAGVADAFRRNDELLTATVWPLGEGRPWGGLVIGEALGRSSLQGLFVSIGSQNAEPGGLFVTDRKGTVVMAAEPTLIGQQFLTPDEVGDLPADTARELHPTRAGNDTTVIAQQLRDGFAVGFEQRTDLLLGDLRAAQHQRDLTLIGVLGAALTALVLFQLAREVAARRDEARLDALLANGQDMIAVVDDAGAIAFLSAAVDHLLGHPADVWRRRPLTDLCHPDDAARVRALLGNPAAGPLLNLRLRTAGGEYRWFDVEASDLRTHPEVAGILLTCHEIGERKRLQDELSYQATHDRLTGLPNRAEFTERLERLVVLGRPVRPFALLYVDLDHFKPINDSLGHDAGDHVLVTVADRLREAAGEGGFVSRLGGDEFAILLDGADGNAALATAERLLVAARTPIAVSATLAHLDASIGIALADPSISLHSVEQLVRRADEAMYRAKRAGRGRYDFAATASSSAPAPAAVGLHGGPGPAAAAAERGADAPPGWPVDEDDPGSVPRHRRFRGMVPTLAAATIVLAIAAVGFGQTTAGRRAAEAERLANLGGANARAAVYYSSIYDPAKTAAIANSGPWTLDGGPIDQRIVEAWTTNPQVGRNAAAFLVRPDRTVIAQAPGAAATAAITGDAWAAAVAGRAGYIPWVNDPDEPRSYCYLPINRNGSTVAVLVFGFSVRNGAGQEEMERVGSAGYASGGPSLMLSDGVVYSSWNPELIGRRLADPATLAGIRPGEASALIRDDAALTVAPVTATAVPTYVAIEIPLSAFYQDLRRGELQRDLSLLALVVTAVAGLAVVNHRREQAVRRSEQRLDSLLQNAHDVVVVMAADGRATFVSSAVHRLLGYRAADRVGQEVVDLVHPSDRPRVAQLVANLREHGRGSVTDVRVRDARGDHRWFDLDAVDLRDRPEVGGILLTCHEVSERKALQDQLAYRAKRDPLTGLPNRATLGTVLEQLVEQPDAGPFAVLFVDLDHFKPVNDTLGHDAGDEVLRVIADRFRLSVRGADESRSGDVVCRLGGDEFAIVLLNVTEEIAQATAARLVQVAHQPITVGNRTVQVGATIGVSVSHPHREDPNQAVRKADQAMYSAKEAGRNTFAVAPRDA